VAVASVRHHVIAQGLLELPVPPPKRGVLALSVMAAAILGAPDQVDAIVATIAPQAELDPTLALRTVRRLIEQLEAAQAHGR
jgi:hypothetical protein